MRKILNAAVSFSVIAAYVICRDDFTRQRVEPPGSTIDNGDPLADNTDVYAFRSTETGRENYVTLIANFIPLEIPGGGPHYYRFDDTVLYEIKIDNTGDGVEDISYQFQFSNQIRNGDTVLGMAAPTEALSGKGGIDPLITDLNDPDYNEVQTYSLTRVDKTTGKNGKILATDRSSSAG